MADSPLDQTTIRITPELKKRARIGAAERDMSMQELFIKAVEVYLGESRGEIPDNLSDTEKRLLIWFRSPPNPTEETIRDMVRKIVERM